MLVVMCIHTIRAELFRDGLEAVWLCACHVQQHRLPGTAWQPDSLAAHDGCQHSRQSICRHLPLSLSHTPVCDAFVQLKVAPAGVARSVADNAAQHLPHTACGASDVHQLLALQSPRTQVKVVLLLLLQVLLLLLQS